MKSCQICAGNVPPATAMPCTLVHLDRRIRIADPDGGREVRRVADEPGVAEVLRRAGLARRGAAEVGARARAGEHVALEDPRHLVGDPVREDALALRLAPAGLVVVGAVREDDLADRHRPRIDAAGGEGRVRRGHLEHRDRVRAETDRGDRLELRPDSHAVRDLGDVLRAEVERQARVDRVVGGERRARDRDAARVAVRSRSRRPRRSSGRSPPSSSGPAASGTAPRGRPSCRG